MNRNWNYQDIIDLEFFFNQDSDGKSSELHSRDRQIYLRYADAQLQEPEEDSPSLLAIWLQARREAHTGATSLPGTIAHESHALLRFILILSGIFTGGSAGLVFFSYSGATPVNVLHFLVLFVFTQLLLTVLLLIRGGLLRLGLRSLPRNLTVRTVAALCTRIIDFLLRQGKSRMAARQRLAVQAAYGRIKAGNTTYSTLLYWPLFQLIQLGAVCFNLGLLGATFLKVMISDVAFGWQSTLQFSSQSLYVFVKWVALPWAWLLGEGTAYPTLSEIEGSRIILKEGIAGLMTPDLVSWWPFMLLCILFYGLLLRILLYGYGWYGQHKAAANLEFTTPAARQVLRRMRTPVVSTQAQPEPTPATQPRKVEQPEETESPSPEEHRNPIHLLVPDEIFDQCGPAALATHLAREGYHIDVTRRFMIDYESDQQLLKDLAKEDWSGSAGIVVLMEAWMPPLVSFQTFLKELRTTVGTGLPIMLRLVGKPSTQTPLTPVKDATLLTIWRQKTESLGDAYLEIGVLIEEEAA